MSTTKTKRTSAFGSGSATASGSTQTSPSPPESVLPSEEDISRGFWPEDEHSGGMDSGESTMRLKEKGKEKEKEERKRGGAMGRRLDEEYEEEDGEGEVEVGIARYPPTKEQELESRRIQENLRRWELNERQRRKVARESVSSLPPSTSIVADVTRKASLFWTFTGRPKVKRPSASDGGGQHHVLRSTDDLTGADGGGGPGTGVQMDDLDSPGVSPSPRLSGEGNGDANPFATPNASRTSLNMSQQRSVIMAESASSPEDIDSVLTPTSNNTWGEETPTTATHLVVPKPRRERAIAESSMTAPPPPKPLDLPRPRTPPPRTETPHANKPPEPIPPPAVSRNEGEEEEEVRRPTRWWTDWLCGCVESGDHQAGRTNPFE